MAKNQLLAETDPKKLRQAALSSFLGFFVFLGAFMTGHASTAILLGAERSALAYLDYATYDYVDGNLSGDGLELSVPGAPFGTGTPPKTPYKDNDVPSIRDAWDFGRLRGVHRYQDQNGQWKERICQLADYNCDGTISESEWRAWGRENIGRMKDRCRVLDCEACRGGATRCWGQLSYEDTLQQFVTSNFLATLNELNDKMHGYDMSKWAGSNWEFMLEHVQMTNLKNGILQPGKLGSWGYNFHDIVLDEEWITETWDLGDGTTVGSFGFDLSSPGAHDITWQDAGIGTDFKCFSATGCNQY